MSIGSALRKLAVVLGMASAPLSPAGATRVESTPATAPRTETLTTAPSLTGTASYYGTSKDRFGHVDKNDPLVRHLLLKNSVPVDRLPVRFLAAQFLKTGQIEALYRLNPNKYRLLTASGAVLDPREAIAAMDKQYVGKQVMVTNVANGKHMIVKVTDTGSFQEKYGRVIDVSASVAEKLGFSVGGLAHVQIRVLN